MRLSQECVELSLKASLRAAGIEYPKVHDVSDILIEVKDRFPEWFRSEMDFLCYSSRILAKKRELSFYGGEEALLSPDDVIGREDAEDAVKRAEHVHKVCRKLIEESEK
ncbi:MAG: HEPN domain-containing protein [Candidatus Bathyarchaeia archaeon]